MSFFENTRKPQGLGGKVMVSMMNLGHSALADWGLRFLDLSGAARVLDCGCDSPKDDKWTEKIDGMTDGRNF